MALIPVVFNDFFDDTFIRPRVYNQDLGLALPEIADFIQDFSVPLRSGYLRPWRNRSSKNSGMSRVINTKDSFQVNLDVQQFKPDELNVKVLDKYIVVEGNHEERGDEHGYVSRKFTRRYRLPKNVDQQAITSTLSSDGVLQLHAPKKVLPESEGRTIPITQSDQPAAIKNKNPKKGKNQTPKK